MADRPNILFFFPDQHRFDYLGRNPDVPVRTPNIDRIAGQGVTFDNVVCPSPVCAPSRACVAAGKRYDRCRVPGNGFDFPLDQATYFQHLRDAGYHVCGVGKFDLHKNTLDWGLDGTRMIEEWGFSEGIDNEGKYDGTRSGAEKAKGPYLAYLHERGLAAAHVKDFKDRHGFAGTFPTPLPDEAYCDNWIAENGLNFMRAFPKDKPWQLVINFTGPHNPMDITQSMHDARPDVKYPAPVENDEYELEQHNEIRKNYGAMIENIDRHVGRFLDLLEERGELDNTLIVYSSDHGEMLGDHNRWGKSTWHQPSVGVPLVVSGPGVRRGATSPALVEIEDLAATYLDLAGAEPLPDADAISLMPTLRGEEPEHRDVVLSGLKDFRTIWDGRMKLVRREGEPDRLFDLASDPTELENLAESHPDETRRLNALLDEALS